MLAELNPLQLGQHPAGPGGAAGPRTPTNTDTGGDYVIASLAAQRQAAALIELAAEGHLDEHIRGLIAQARTQPTRAAELIAVLAETVVALQPGARPPGVLPAPERPQRRADVPPLMAYLRRAHAAYAAGSQLPWAVQGEREYQRLKKRDQRARARVVAA